MITVPTTLVSDVMRTSSSTEIAIHLVSSLRSTTANAHIVSPYTPHMIRLARLELQDAHLSDPDRYIKTRKLDREVSAMLRRSVCEAMWHAVELAHRSPTKHSIKVYAPPSLTSIGDGICKAINEIVLGTPVDVHDRDTNIYAYGTMIAHTPHSLRGTVKPLRSSAPCTTSNLPKTGVVMRLLKGLLFIKSA